MKRRDILKGGLAAGALAWAGAAALSKFGGYDTSLRWVSGDDDSGARRPVGFP